MGKRAGASVGWLEKVNAHVKMEQFFACGVFFGGEPTNRFVWVSTHTRTKTHTFTHTHSHTHTFTHTHTHTRTHARARARLDCLGLVLSPLSNSVNFLSHAPNSTRYWAACVFQVKLLEECVNIEFESHLGSEL